MASSSTSRNSIPIEKQYAWKFLGVGCRSKEDEEISKQSPLPPLNIDVTPKNFMQFYSLATSKTKTDIFSNNQVKSISDIMKDNKIHDSMMVRLLFSYKYIWEIRNGGNVIKTIIMTPQSHGQGLKLFLMSKFGIDVEKIYPSSVSVTLTPYKAFRYKHEPGIDIEVYYRWENTYNVIARELEEKLHIWFRQEPIPVVTFLDDHDYYGHIEWSFLGVKGIDMNRLEFDEGKIVNGFMKSFPQGRLSYRIKSGMSVRVCNVITPANKKVCGLLMKVECGILKLELGRVLEFNPDFHDKNIQVLYRWRNGQFLELSMSIQHGQ